MFFIRSTAKGGIRLKIVLVGAGEVGYYVAKDLSADGHDIVVVEENEERAQRVENDLDVIVVRGNGARPSVLERAGVKEGCEDISLLIACTNKDEVNIMACWIAKKWAFRMSLQELWAWSSRTTKAGRGSGNRYAHLLKGQ